MSISNKDAYDSMVANQYPPYETIFSNPIKFDRDTFNILGSRYGTYLHRVIRDVQREEYFKSAEINSIIHSNLDHQLICKQVLPLFATADAYGKLEKFERQLISFAKQYILIVTSTYNSIDSQIDLCVSYNTETDLSEKWNMEKVSLFGISSIISGFKNLFYEKNGEKLVEIISDVYSDISEIMFLDYEHRFDTMLLESTNEAIEKYLTSELSALVGSGFYEVTIRAAMQIIEEDITNDQMVFMKDFRRLRQIVDEIADVVEDVRVGRVTLPFLLALLNPKYKKQVDNLIRDIWKTSNEVIDNYSHSKNRLISELSQDPKLKALTDTLYDKLIKSGVFDLTYNIAEQIFTNVVSGLKTHFPRHNMDGLVRIAYLKKAFLERLKRQNWRDVPLKPVRLI